MIVRELIYFVGVYLFKYNLIHYKDTLFVNDQMILVSFPIPISGQLAQITAVGKENFLSSHLGSLANLRIKLTSDRLPGGKQI